MKNIFHENLIVSLLSTVAIKNICERFFPFGSIHMRSVFDSLLCAFRFDVNQPSFFTAAIRSRIVKFILDRIRFSTETTDSYAFGIDRLISDEVYMAAYPLHDVSVSTLISN